MRRPVSLAKPATAQKRARWVGALALATTVAELARAEPVSPPKAATAQEPLGGAQEPSPDPRPALQAQWPALRLEQVAFDNGLRLVIDVAQEPASPPAVAICTQFQVGTRDEPSDLPGLAGLAARLAARGLPTGTEIDVTADFSRFCTEVPAGRLGIRSPAPRLRLVEPTAAELALALAHPLEGQLGDSAPWPTADGAFASATAKLFQLAFEGHPYQRGMVRAAVPGAVHPSDIRAFWAAHYRPDAAVVSIVGDVVLARATEFVRAAFMETAGRAVARSNVPDASRQTTERYTALEPAPGTGCGPSVSAVYGWVIPGATKEHRALQLAARILGDGEDSRLHQNLVRTGLAQAVGAQVAGLGGPDLLEVRFALAPGHLPDDAKHAIDATINALRTAGPSAAELDRVRRGVEAELLTRLQSRVARARWLAEYAAAAPASSPAVTEVLDSFLDIEPADVRNAVGLYLTPTRRTIVEVFPPGLLDARLPVRPTRAANPSLSAAQTSSPSSPPKAAATQTRVNPRNQRPRGNRSATVTPKIRVHVIRKGETASSIARRYAIGLPALISENHLQSSASIVAGQKLRIPAPASPRLGAAAVQEPARKQ
jgi:zinc protease